MRAAATAAGYLYASGRLRRRGPRQEQAIKPKDGEVEALAKQLVDLFNVKPERARELAVEQSQKRITGRRR